MTEEEIKAFLEEEGVNMLGMGLSRTTRLGFRKGSH